ncbi:MAG: type II toxin-antitoxin system Phd/YefM family antitoxin [Clostridiales bacterium]|nr:type II toxin-antitoxin system Phd/YefM family antitoxin [Clostridiales bacterium]
MSMALAEFTEKLVSVSDFSQGKAGKIFSDVAENDSEYIVLKNNQPTAVLMSPAQYREIQRKLAQLDRVMAMAENIRLLRLAESRDVTKTTTFEDFVKEQGFTMEELEELSESVEIE